MKPNSILFLPGTGLSHQFYSPLISVLGQHGIVNVWDYRHRESMVEACKRLGGSAQIFSSLRHEVCFGPLVDGKTRLNIKLGEGIAHWYEGLARDESVEELWLRTIIVGHSQGAGHALLFSQLKVLAGAVMISGPADASDGQLASWTRQPFSTPPSRRLLLVHAKDSGCRATLAHAEACGLRVMERQGAMPEHIGGVALIDTEAVPPLSAHGCIAGAQTWDPGSTRHEEYCSILSRHLQAWCPCAG